MDTHTTKACVEDGIEKNKRRIHVGSSGRYCTAILLGVIVLSASIIFHGLCQRYDLQYDSNGIVLFDKLTGSFYTHDSNSSSVVEVNLISLYKK